MIVLFWQKKSIEIDICQNGGKQNSTLMNHHNKISSLSLSHFAVMEIIIICPKQFIELITKLNFGSPLYASPYGFQCLC